MARVTVEDCVDKIPNRFELVLTASKRVRQLTREAATPTVPAGNDKMTVVALREIALGVIDEAAINHSSAIDTEKSDDFATVTSAALKPPIKLNEPETDAEDEEELAEIMGTSTVPEDEMNVNSLDDSSSE